MTFTIIVRFMKRISLSPSLNLCRYHHELWSEHLKKDETDVAPSRSSRAFETPPDALASTPEIEDAAVQDENANENQKRDAEKLEYEDTIVTPSGAVGAILVVFI